MTDYHLKYQYIYFNSNYLGRGAVDRNEYNSICLRDAETMGDVYIVSRPLGHKSSLLRTIFQIHMSSSINKFIKLPCKNLWYPFYFPKRVINDKPICFVIATVLPMDYLFYLKKIYPNCKVIKIHRDLLTVMQRNNPDYTEENMQKIFDLRMTYDEKDAAKYNMVHFDEIESKIKVDIDKNYPLSDVFFAGRAKDRLSKIIKAYEIFTEAGLKCDFYITHVPKDQQIEKAGIKYLKKYMPYLDMLYKTVNSRCVLDINQEGAVGYTSRILEAILYNKKIILDNQSVKKSKYYNPEFMQVVDSIENIDPKFVLNDVHVDYHYEGDFSPINLICKIDEELRKKFG